MNANYFRSYSEGSKHGNLLRLRHFLHTHTHNVRDIIYPNAVHIYIPGRYGDERRAARKYTENVLNYAKLTL